MIFEEIQNGIPKKKKKTGTAIGQHCLNIMYDNVKKLQSQKKKKYGLNYKTILYPLD